MPRKTFSNGQILFAEDVNQIGYPIVDGADILGHGAKVIDDYLDDAPDQLKSRFYSWFNRFRVSLGSGLSVNISNGLVNANGIIINIPPQSIVVPNNATSFIWIGTTQLDSTVLVRVSDALPNNCIALARVVAASSNVTSITDLREVYADFLPPSIPDAVPVGSFILSLLPPTEPVPTGYIELQDNPINVSRVVYSNLFAKFGTYYGAGDGSNTFGLPGKGNRYLRLSNSGMTPGSSGGSNQITIGTNNLPAHSHTINDVPHTHTATDSGHNHIAGVAAHSHTVNETPHTHLMYCNTTDAPRDAAKTDGFGKIGTAITGEDLGGKGYINVNGSGVPLMTSNVTGITVNSSSPGVTINNSQANISVTPSNSGITTTNNTGSGLPITHEQPYLAVRVFVKF